ncbi:MAG: hypothetical protein NVS3B1_11740 [Marmoricola sp.]
MASNAPLLAARILEALPERYRQILEQRFIEACSIKETAQAMNIGVSNAKVHATSRAADGSKHLGGVGEMKNRPLWSYLDPSRPVVDHGPFRPMMKTLK